MINWNQSPFIRLLIPLITGISAANLTDIAFGEMGLYSLFGLIILFIIFTFIPVQSSYKNRHIPGIFIFVILLTCGFVITNINTTNDSHFPIEEASNYTFQTLEPAVEKANSYKITGRITSEDKPGEKVIIYFEKDIKSSQIQYGDLLILNCTLNEIKPPQNPEEFNYKKYLQNRGIKRQSYISIDKWEKIGSDKGNLIISFGYQLRNKLLKILEENDLSGKEYAVASAILLGFDDKLDKELVSEFSGSGAMHILCVSGLHVGIIYFIFSSILFFLNQKKWQRLLKTILLLLLIWIYAMITGFSPSVLRASTMFSFIIIGQSINRRTNIYNSLAASAFLLLLFNPFFIFEVGFQLSYFAVVGIVSIHPMLFGIWIPKNLLLRKTWSLVVVSIVAQIATFPLSLYYFHQFPNFFILTNLVAIPASTVILYSGLLVLAFSPIPFISNLFAKILSWTIQGLNTSVKFIENAPYSTLQDIQISTFEMVLFYLFSISIIVAISQKRKAIILTSFSIFILLLGSFTFRKYENTHQQKITVYNIQNCFALDFIDGKKRVFIADSILMNTSDKQDFHIKNHIVANGINKSFLFNIDKKELKSDIVFRKDNFFQFKNKRILLIDKGFEIMKSDRRISLDYIIIANNPEIEMGMLTEEFIFKELVFSSYNKKWAVTKWIEECDKLGYNYHNVNKEGAWQYEF